MTYTLKITIPNTGSKTRKRTYYWDGHGLHSGKSKSRGYNTFELKNEAILFIKHLKFVLNGWYKIEIIESREIPFIREQIKKIKIKI